MSEWKEVTLVGISSNVQYGYTESANSKPIGPKFLRITDIRNYFVDWDTVPYCPISSTNHQKYSLKKGDICIARTGATTGISTVIKQDVNAVFASYLVRFQIDQKIANPFFVGYSLKSQSYQDYISRLC